MKFKGNGLSLSVAGLALAVAMSGTAYAVTATSVTITDPNNAANIAKVDGTGHLLTVQATSTIANTGNFQNVGTTPLTGATRAAIAITEMQVAETRLNGTVNGSDLFVQIEQVSASGTTCGTDVLRTLFTTALGSEQVIDLAPPVPLVVKPVAAQPYCLVLVSLIDNGGTDETPNFPQYRFTGYAATGTYTGVGSAARPAPAARSDRKPATR